jgi:predicted flavoprotein YhiN
MLKIHIDRTEAHARAVLARHDETDIVEVLEGMEIAIEHEKSLKRQFIDHCRASQVLSLLILNELWKSRVVN